jgi:prepilin-type N-terminal cleavage/methylation domain-containing protein
MRIKTAKKPLSDMKRRGFTFVEVVAAVVLLSIMISSVLVMMDRFVSSISDMRLRQQAFELARSNMETLLSESTLSDLYEYGESEINPDIQWEKTVEPFYEPFKNRMWIRAVCSGSFINSKDEEEKVELEHWITNLTAAQIKQILAQQETEAAYLDLLYQGRYNETQLATIAYLEEAKLDVEAYKGLLEDHRRQKLEYLDKNGMNDGFDKLTERLQREEDVFLANLGMNFDEYNKWAESYVPPKQNDPLGPDDTNPTVDPNPTDNPDPKINDQWVPDWNTIPRELWPILEHLLGVKPPS